MGRQKVFGRSQGEQDKAGRDCQGQLTYVLYVFAHVGRNRSYA
jgi:hypothetical protein